MPTGGQWPRHMLPRGGDSVFGMAKLIPGSNVVRQFILEKVERHPPNLAKLVANHFDITRQSVNWHLQRMVREKC